MGSAALQDAIKGITDWGVTVGQVTGKLPKATDAFGSLTFNDEMQKGRLPKPVYQALRRTITARRTARSRRRPTSSPRR